MGSLFQSLGAAAMNARSPNVFLVAILGGESRNSVVKVVVVKREHHSEYWYSGSLLTLKSPSCYETSSQLDHD